MLCPTRAVVDATGNRNDGGVAAEVCSSPRMVCDLHSSVRHLCMHYKSVYVLRTTYDPIYSSQKINKKPARRSGLEMDLENIFFYVYVQMFRVHPS